VGGGADGGAGSGVGEGSGGLCGRLGGRLRCGLSTARGVVVMPPPVAVGLRQSRVGLSCPVQTAGGLTGAPFDRTARPAADTPLAGGAAPPFDGGGVRQRAHKAHREVHIPTRHNRCIPQNGGAKLTPTWAPEFRPQQLPRCALADSSVSRIATWAPRSRPSLAGESSNERRNGSGTPAPSAHAHLEILQHNPAGADARDR
jgi:hypothetical protein